MSKADAKVQEWAIRQAFRRYGVTGDDVDLLRSRITGVTVGSEYEPPSRYSEWTWDEGIDPTLVFTVHLTEPTKVGNEPYPFRFLYFNVDLEVLPTIINEMAEL